MKKFETPEIEVVMFKTNDVISTSFGEGYEGGSDVGGWSSQGASASQLSDEMPF